MKPLPVNFRATVEKPLADMPEGAADDAADRMETVGFWDHGAPSRRLGLYNLDAVDLAVFLLCSLRARKLWSGTRADIAAAMHLDEHHVNIIFATTKQRLKL